MINSLNPASIYVGIDEFEGYFVFYFPDELTAILECPIVGNAIYIIKGDWQTLSQLNKRELLTDYQMNVRRVIHKGDWFSRLKQKLYS